MKRSGADLTRIEMYTRAKMGHSAQQALFHDLWRSYYRGLYMFIRRFESDLDEVDDAVQEVMLKVFRNLHTYRPSFAISTWIYSIARNHCIDVKRYRNLRETGIVHADPDTMPGVFPLPEEQLLQSDTTCYVDQLIKTFASEDQQIALLRFFEEMPYRQISAVMELPIGTLKYRVHRIRQLLKKRREEIHGG